MKVASAGLLRVGIALFCLGCGKGRQGAQPMNTAPPAPAVKQAPATPIAEKKVELGGATWDPQWDLFVERSLPPDLLSATAARAVRSYCPRFVSEPEADKRAFWAYVFQALAGAEAGLDPTTSVRHLQAAVNRQDTVSHRPVRQEGLLQLTYQDAERYGCEFNWKQDRKLGENDPGKTILQPERNLACGLSIMENQIIKQNKPLIVRSSYWATLQPGTASYRVFAKQMANAPAACGVGVRQMRRKK